MMDQKMNGPESPQGRSRLTERWQRAVMRLTLNQRLPAYLRGEHRVVGSSPTLSANIFGGTMFG